MGKREQLINYNDNFNRVLDDLQISEEVFSKLIDAIKKGLSSINVNPEDVKIVYKRNFDATSVLAIKLKDGGDFDTTNYMVVSSEAYKNADKVTCNVEMQGNEKISVEQMKLANLISRNIVEFFEEIENGLYKNNNFDLSISLTILLDERKKQEENGKNKLIKSIFKRK